MKTKQKTTQKMIQGTPPDETAAEDLPLVAIVTPVYNGARYLEEALACVQGQTYTNIVHVVLDNASTDATPVILERYRNARVPVLIQRNDTLLPLTDNWDKAFSLIPREAQFAKLLCADDLMRADCIEKFVALCLSNPSVETVSCQDVHGDLIRRAHIPPGQTVLDGKQATRAILDRSINWLPFQHLFVRLHPEDFDGPFFGTGEYGADPYAVVRSALRGSFGYLHEPLVYTRWHDGSASNNLRADARTPVYASQINLMLMTYFKMLRVFGPQCWDEADFNRVLTFARDNLARTLLRWRVRRFDIAYNDLKTGLAALGYTFGRADFTRATATTPLYLAWKRKWRTTIGPRINFVAPAVERSVIEACAEDMPLVAIVTPVYNGGKWLEKTMASVQAQTYPNLVHVVLDNASQDNTADIIERHIGGRVPIIAYRNAKPVRLQDNWNKAFSFLPEDTTYAKLLCADDVIRADCIERFVNLAESDPEVQLVLSDDVHGDKVRKASLSGGEIHEGRAIAERVLDGTIGWLGFQHFFVRVDPADRGPNFCGNNWAQDPFIVLRSLLRGKFGYIHEPMIYSRWHADSVTSSEVTQGGITFWLAHLTLMQTFRAAFASRKRYEAAVRDVLTRLCRLILVWNITKQKTRALKLRGALQHEGYRLSLALYVYAIVIYPAYALNKMLTQSSPAESLKELDFLKLASTVANLDLSAWQDIFVGK